MLTSDKKPRDARKRWLADQLRAKGTLTLDDGACRVLTEKGSSLLAVGVTACDGKFLRGDLVSCVNGQGVEIARGLSNYSEADTRRILGKSSDRFGSILGFAGEPELVHRDNMIIVR